MKKIILFLLTFALTISLINNVVYADNLIFEDDFGNSFTYDNSWSYYQDDLNDGYITYIFENKNGETLQLSYKSSTIEITKDDVISMCDESNGEFVYKGAYIKGFNGRTWFITEYQTTVLCYYGTTNSVLYRICISSSKTGEAYELVQNIMHEVSADSSSFVNTSANTNEKNDNDLKIGIIGALITIFVCLVVPFIIKKIVDKTKNENNNINEQCDNSNKLPMKWFKFTKYFRCPVMIIIEILNLSYLSDFVFTDITSFLTYLVCVCCLISNIIFMVGTWGGKMQRRAYVAKIWSIISNCLLSCLLLIQNSAFYSIGAAILVAYLEYVYFKNRESLFIDAADVTKSKINIPVINKRKLEKQLINEIKTYAHVKDFPFDDAKAISNLLSAYNRGNGYIFFGFMSSNAIDVLNKYPDLYYNWDGLMKKYKELGLFPNWDISTMNEMDDDSCKKLGETGELVEYKDNVASIDDNVKNCNQDKEQTLNDDKVCASEEEYLNDSNYQLMKKIENLCIEESKRCMSLFEHDLTEHVKALNETELKNIEDEGYIVLLRKYLITVENNVIATLTNEEINKINIIKNKSSYYEFLANDNTIRHIGFLAGMIFEAKTNIGADTWWMSKINHHQNDLINETLKKVAKNLEDLIEEGKEPITSQEENTEKNKKSLNQKEKILYCRKCGSKLMDDSIFCSKCGCKVKDE